MTSASQAATLAPPMTKRLLLSFLAATIALSTGCLFSKKSRKPKESSAIATEVEIEFKQRWMAKRVADLTAQGLSATAAQQQATQEFDEKFSFAKPQK